MIRPHSRNGKKEMSSDGQWQRKRNYTQGTTALQCNVVKRRSRRELPVRPNQARLQVCATCSGWVSVYSRCTWDEAMRPVSDM